MRDVLSSDWMIVCMCSCVRQDSMLRKERAICQHMYFTRMRSPDDSVSNRQAANSDYFSHEYHSEANRDASNNQTTCEQYHGHQATD